MDGKCSENKNDLGFFGKVLKKIKSKKETSDNRVLDEKISEEINHGKILNDLYKSLGEIVKIKCFEITKENANMNSETPSGMMMKFASELSKSYIDNNILCKDKEIKNES